MKTYKEWQDEMNGFHLFMNLLHSPDLTTIQVFCDWLEDIGMTGAAEWIRSESGPRGQNAHGYWSKMAADLGTEGIVLSDNLLTWQGNKYRLLHNQVMTVRNGKWVPAEEKEIIKIFPGLAVMMFIGVRASNVGVDEDYKTRLLSRHFHTHLGEISPVAIQLQKVAENGGKISNPLLQTIIRITQEIESTVAQIPQQYRDRFEIPFNSIGHYALTMMENIRRSFGNQPMPGSASFVYKAMQGLQKLSQL